MKDDLRAKREAAKNKPEEESKTEATEEIPKHLVRDFLASGSRDKTIRLWEAK